MIYYPKVFGICGGANKAIDLAYKLNEEYKNKNIYIYKEILHNKFIIDSLKKKNILCIDDLSIVTKNDILILRAHGEAKETYDYLDSHNITYYDATCINVQKVHELVSKKYNENYNIIIVGKKNHSEVVGTNGWCNNTAVVIENESDYKYLDKSKKYYVVCQTTTTYEKLSNLLNYLKEKKFNYEYDNTICNAQKLIQTSSVSLAKVMDMMIVIGGENSANSKELFNECNKVCKSYFFSNINDFYNFIKKTKITYSTKIGITGGASTPKTQIYEFSHLLEFMIYYKNKRKEIDTELKKFNKSLKPNNNKLINDTINKFLNINSGGKYLRGCLIDLGYKINKSDNYAKYLSVAYETFQTAILVHDDIIDNAILRRGKETIHYTYEKEFEKYSSNESVDKNLALCAGDIGFYYAYELIVKKYKNDKNLPKLLSCYNNIVINTIKGEILDVYLPFKEQYDKNNVLKEDDIFEIYKLKTSYYSIVGPFVMGMILGGSKQKELDKMSNILEPLGYSFQIKDDILGIFSSNNILGKSVYSDIEEFKQTILYSYIKLNKPDYYKELLKYYGKKDLDENDIKKVQKIIIDSGSLDYANNKLDELFFKTKEQVKFLNINEYVKNILLGFITYLELREK